ncbi:MAG TPA: HAMP domain-containing sensor histidine kinase, partial [Candidatus Eisenbacteria bacterium]|nr:HAMP domain-containing sensor histidine kinase [Candidatus Eisenbacteria bacterium]
MKSGHQNKKNRALGTGEVAPKRRPPPRGTSARATKPTPETQNGLRKKAEALGAEMHRHRDLDVDLRDPTAELAESDRRKDEFLATLAHELRNPLAPIKMAAMLARTNCTCAGSHRYLDMIERQADNLTRIVDDLIEISRLTHGKLTLQRERIALDTIVTRAVDSARSYLDQRHHRVSVELP